jgi:radical SAM superfamily enzyme YgiQ (UPF0313 family)
LGAKHELSFERGTIFKKWSGRTPVCVLFPNTYFVGMSNLAVHLLYKGLNDVPDVVCERAFLDTGGKTLSVESRKPLASFEIIFVTLSFEMDYGNLVRMLSDSSIEPLASTRRGPIIVGGGVCAMANPEPLAGVFDLFIMGDIEATIIPFMDLYFSNRHKRRAELIDELSRPHWVYNPAHLSVTYKDDGTVEAFKPPSFYVKSERYKGRHLGTSAILTSQTEFANMYLVEGTRGCPSRCPFCLTGSCAPFTYDRSPHVPDGETSIGIIGGGVSFHPALGEMIREFKSRGVRVNLPSLRVDQVPLDVLELVKDEVRTLTFGVEAATERLRRFVGKPLSDADIYERIEAIAAMKSFHFKLYFMIGLPGETREDVSEIVTMAKRIMHFMIKQGSKRGTVGSITIHASPFVPKAATPFQWLAMADVDTLKEKLGALRKGLARAANTFFTHESVKYSFLQGVFARGDRRVQDVIMQLAAGTPLGKVQRENPLNLNFYVTRERMPDERFPWDFLTGEKEKMRLRKQFDAAMGTLVQGSG